MLIGAISPFNKNTVLYGEIFELKWFIPLISVYQHKAYGMFQNLATLNHSEASIKHFKWAINLVHLVKPCIGAAGFVSLNTLIYEWAFPMSKNHEQNHPHIHTHVK